jgi:C1A family cysteine protease
MKSVFIACLLLSAAFAASQNMEDLWDQWKTKYNVQYPTAQEDAQRFAIFCQNYEFIQQYNAAHENSKLALNKFSAYTNDEFKALFTGYNHGQFDASSTTTTISDFILDETSSQTGSETASKTGSTPASTPASTPSGSAPAGQTGSAETSSMEGSKYESAHSVAPTNPSTSPVAPPVLSGTAASAWNWVQQGYLNPVQNQEQCGSCWSFSTTAAMEALYKINTGKLLKFSEQQFVDCDRNDYGCNGGVPNYAMQYVAQFGQMLESAYPYVAEVGSCSYNANQAVKGITTGAQNIAQNNVNALKASIYQVPTVVAVEATAVLQSYSSGVLDNTSGCTSNLDHAVLAVGYGPYAGKDTFMVRNSWGADWGVNGYFYISTNYDNNGAGTCGILGYPVAPTGRKVAH